MSYLTKVSYYFTSMAVVYDFEFRTTIGDTQNEINKVAIENF